MPFITVSHSTPTLIKFSDALLSDIYQNHTLNIFPPVFWYVPLDTLRSDPVRVGVVRRAVEDTILPLTSASSWDAFGELALPLGAGICAACVAGFRNPMHSLLALLGVFFCTAILYLIAGLAFVGVVFLIVYVGAVAVLFLFVIMLLNVKSLTSNEELIQHQSQILAIIFAAALLAQTFFTLGGAFDHLLAIGFLRDAILEATTSEAVSFYVRFQAADINSLTGLYTTHGILLLVTTIVLLVALLGAIILATVTTERALSISDLHPYPKKIVSRTAFLACTLFFLGAEVPNVFIDDFTALDTLDPILFTHYLRGAERDVKLRSLRRFKPDTYTLQSYRYSAQRYKYKPYREPLKFENIDFVLPESVSESDLSTSAERRWKTNKMGRGLLRVTRRSRWWACKITPTALRVHFSKLALAPVFARRYLPARKVLIVRRRWLWRWRSNRAAWLRRLLIKRGTIPDDLHPYFKERRKYPRWPVVVPGEKIRFKHHYYRRIAVRIRPALRLFGKRRMPFFKFLRLVFITKVYSRIFYYAWHLRALCSAFICFFFILPPFITFVWLFAEEQNFTWETLCDVHPATVDVLKRFTDLGKLNIIYANILAVPLYLPMLMLNTVGEFSLFHVLIALAFAWDSVTSHGGELSDIEFHESRCNYWRKKADDYTFVPDEDDIPLEVERPWLKGHPDKGRTDIKWTYFDMWSKMPFPFNLYAYGAMFVDILVAILRVIFDVVVILTWPIWKTIECIGKTEGGQAVVHAAKSVYKEAVAAPGILRETIISSAQAFLEAFPFLVEWYALAISTLVATRAELIALGKLVWSYIHWGFYKIEYTPYFLTKFLSADIARQYYTMVVGAILAAVAVYSISVFVILVMWKRIYGKEVHRPPIYLYLLAFVVSLYFFAVLGQHVQFHQFRLYDYLTPELRYAQVWLELRRRRFFIFTIMDGLIQHRYLTLVLLYLVYNAIRQLINRRRTRLYTYTRPIVFRSYYNYYLRAAHHTYGAEFRQELASELAAFPSTELAQQATAQQGKEEEAADDAADKEESMQFIWIRLVYIPTFYDPHPNLKYRKHPDAFALVVENHYDNPHHSV